MSGGRYAYRAKGFELSIISTTLISGAAGSGVGLLVGGGFVKGEMAYDSYYDRTVRSQNPNEVFSIGTANDNAT